jgi:hypothetical protein
MRACPCGRGQSMRACPCGRGQSMRACPCGRGQAQSTPTAHAVSAPRPPLRNLKGRPQPSRNSRRERDVRRASGAGGGAASVPCPPLNRELTELGPGPPPGDADRPSPARPGRAGQAKWPHPGPLAQCVSLCTAGLYGTRRRRLCGVRRRSAAELLPAAAYAAALRQSCCLLREEAGRGLLLCSSSALRQSCCLLLPTQKLCGRAAACCGLRSSSAANASDHARHTPGDVTRRAPERPPFNRLDMNWTSTEGRGGQIQDQRYINVLYIYQIFI